MVEKIGGIVAELRDYSTTSLQANVAFLQKLADVKGFDELTQIQTDHSKAFFEASLALSKKVGELVADLSVNAIKSVAVNSEDRSDSIKVPSVGMPQAAE